MNHALRGRPGRADVIAGASVALVLIPQSMAYAELAGLPPQIGLFAAALPCLLAAPFVSSPYLQTGPGALTALLTFGALSTVADPFSVRYIELAILLALMVGVVRLVLGGLKLGNLAYLLSQPVLTGFTTGAAILILASQMPQAFGVATERDGVLRGAWDALSSTGDWQRGAVLYALATAALVVIGRRIHPLFPGVLLAVAGAIVVSELTDYQGSTIGRLPGGFITLHPDFPFGSLDNLLPAAVAIGLIGFAEPASIARMFAIQDRKRWDANREMISQGVANVASALSGGMPVGGSFSRSALNRLAGAQTAWSGAVTGAVVLVTLPFTPLAESLPKAVLAAIVISSVVKLVDLPAIARLFRESFPQGVVGLGTLVATVAFSPRVERGVFVGVLLAIAVHLYRELNVVTEEHVDGSTLTISPKGVLWFATVPKIERIVRSNLADDPTITTVRLDLVGVGRLDYTGASTLQQSIATLEAANVKVLLVNVPPGAERAVGIHIDDSTISENSPDT